MGSPFWFAGSEIKNRKSPREPRRPQAEARGAWSECTFSLAHVIDGVNEGNDGEQILKRRMRFLVLFRKKSLSWCMVVYLFQMVKDVFTDHLYILGLRHADVHVPLPKEGI